MKVTYFNKKIFKR